MDIFGIGGWELVAILLIMLVVAGPKRMIHWAYILGTYVAKMRTMWSEAVGVLQKEFDEAGVDIKLPKEPPTRGQWTRMASDALKPVSEPLKAVQNEVRGELERAQEALTITTNGSGQKTSPNTAASADPPKTGDLGTWSQSPGERDQSDFGTWTTPGKPEE
jgi:Sec-independent protein translocase protein TatA